jgi:hypothetical protein
MLHTAWALATGIAVTLLARDRYHLVGWVALFLLFTWASTLYFGRAAVHAAIGSSDYTPGAVPEITSYVTRVLYQETLFFLLPFYAYSTVAGSPNTIFLLLLVTLAVFSCVDLVFDRLLRAVPVFALVFFSVVTFATGNLLLPLLLGLQPAAATPAAAFLAVGAAIPLAVRAGGHAMRTRLSLVAAAAAMLGIALAWPRLVPPVPLRMERATFASDMDRNTLAVSDSLAQNTSASVLGGALIILVQVFAPTDLPASVQLEWYRNGALVHKSREVSITAHIDGFRVWDSWRPDAGVIPPGKYQVFLFAARRRAFDKAELNIVP